MKPRYFLPSMIFTLAGLAFAEGGQGAAQIAAVQPPPAPASGGGKRVLDDATIERLLALSEPE